MTLQQRKDDCKCQQTHEDSHNVNDTKSRKRELARMTQHKRRQGAGVEQMNARRQKELERVRKRRRRESVEQTIDRRRIVLNSVRKYENESERYIFGNF